MVPSKQLKITDQIRPNKKERPQQKQDDTEPDAHSPDTDNITDGETTQMPQGEAPVSNHSLHVMLQALKESLRTDFRQITKEN
ncbi:Hypothetical predicted protein [Pelobates cultripes]|uniref:Uncharacterized protein n=1 Tax=Pelobates cultripes TaxID=61616 RepID=A0AAD1T359_PELCU|nr:Hypothetical predicted protein [Pelobates cultripes]